MKREKLNVGKKVASIVGITIASILIIFAFCGRFCNTEASQGFMHFANFFVGAFGMAFYGMMAAVIISCACVLAGKTVKIPVKYVINFVLMFIAVTLLVHMLTTTYLPKEFNAHMSLIYHYYDNQMGVPSFGGVVFGLIAWCLMRALSIWGASIVVVLLLAWTVYMAGDFFYKYATGKLSLTAKPSKEDIEPSQATADAVDKPVYDADDPRRKAYEILFLGQQASVAPEVVSQDETSTGKFDVADQSRIIKQQNRTPSPDDAKKILFGDEKSKQNGDGRAFFGKEEKQKSSDEEYLVKGYYQTTKKTEEKPVEEQSDWKISYVPDEQSKIVDEPPKPSAQTFEPQPQPQITQQPIVRQPQRPVTQQPQPQNHYEDIFVDDYDEVDITDVTTSDNDEFVVEEPIVEPIVEQPSRFVAVTPQRKEFVAPEPDPVVVEDDYDPDELVVIEDNLEVDGGVQMGFNVTTQGALDKAKNEIHHYLEYNIPPMDLLNDVTIVEDHDDGERQRLAQAIVNKLAVFNIKIELADIIVGPSVTRYMFTVLSQKTRMGDFKQYSDDIKACVEAQDDIIIDAPVKGTNMVGIEVANKVKRPVVLRSILESPEFQNAKGELTFAIGQEISGQVVVADLTKMPHLLIAGTTGSGKSVCLNCLIVSLMYKYGPEYLRFVMVDPKFVELSRYTGIPHMLTAKTITAMSDALAAMDYLIAEMEARYQMFVTEHVDKITEYNKHINPKLKQKMPYLVFIVDELADLMSSNKKAFEQKLIRLAQKGRACGIHVVLATQRPDTNVITGTIKGNLPCRMALKVASVYDSQTIINGGGAEKLLGYGDMLFMNPTVAGLTRIQGAYIDNDEIRALVKYSSEVNEVYYDNSVSDQIFVAEKEAKKREEEEKAESESSGKDELYPFYKKALRYWLERNNGKASISSIQRGINVGFNRAGRIMENLQRMGYVEELSSSDTSNRALKVLVTLEELDGLFPDEEE